MMRTPAFQALDADRDGKLTKEELPERMQGLFDRADANHDGVLSADEIRKSAQTTSTTPRRGSGRGERI